MTLFADDPNRNWAESLIEGDVRSVPDEIDEDAVEEEDGYMHETEEENVCPECGSERYNEDDEIDVFIARRLAIDA